MSILIFSFGMTLSKINFRKWDQNLANRHINILMLVLEYLRERLSLFIQYVVSTNSMTKVLYTFMCNIEIIHE